MQSSVIVELWPFLAVKLPLVAVHMCVCVSTPVPKERHRGPGRIHRRLVNEAGDVSEDMEMGRQFQVPAKYFNLL